MIERKLNVSESQHARYPANERTSRDSNWQAVILLQAFFCHDRLASIFISKAMKLLNLCIPKFLAMILGHRQTNG
jgi:hypothetical protein